MKKTFTLILVVLFAFLAAEPAFAAVPSTPTVPAVEAYYARQADEPKAETPLETGIPVETVETDSFAMDYFRFGNGDKTLVMIPGLSVQSVMSSADAVAEAYRVMADDFTVYLFDRRKEVPATYSVHEMAQDTAEAFRALGLDHINLVGVSQGGMIAMDIAIHNPDLVENLVLGSTSARITEEEYATIDMWIRLAKAGDAEALYLAFGEAVYPEEVFRQYRDFLIEAAKTVTAEELDRFIILAEGIKGFDDLDALDDISCPILLIGSMDDQVLGAEATVQMAERLAGRPDFELYMYDGYGHAAYDTAPDFKERAAAFILEKSSEI